MRGEHPSIKTLPESRSDENADADLIVSKQIDWEPHQFGDTM